MFLILACYLVYGNFSYAFDNLLIFLLINIAFYSFLKEKKIDLFDFIIFILSTYLVELFLGLSFFISFFVSFLPIFWRPFTELVFIFSVFFLIFSDFSRFASAWRFLKKVRFFDVFFYFLVFSSFAFFYPILFV